MKRSALWCICGLTLLVVPSVSASAAPNRVILDPEGNVRSFYGIPITLTRARLKRLPYRVRKEYYYAEGDRYAQYRITAQDKVDVLVTFERNGKFASAWTESPKAVGFKGMSVGSTLDDLKAAWPDGDFSFYWEDGYVVTFRTPANVSFMFDPKDMPPGAFDHDRPSDFPVPGTIKVKTIAIFPHARPPLKKPASVDLNKTDITISDSETHAMISKLEIERMAGSPSVRLIWHEKDKVRFDRKVDLSNYPDFDIYGVTLLYPDDPVVVSLRYGDFKDCAVKADDRDRVYVKLDSDGATVSLQPPEGSRAIIGEPIPDKYAGRTIGAVAHGCRRTFDPKTGASGLERAYEQTSQLPRQSLVEQK